MKVKNLWLLFPALLLFVSCLETRVKIRVDENGYVAESISYQPYGQDGSYGVALLPSLKQNLSDQGFLITQDQPELVEGTVYTTLDKALNADLFKVDSSSNNGLPPIKGSFKTSMSQSGGTKTFILNNVLPKNEEFIRTSDRLGKEFLELFKISYEVTLPGKILETNGKLVNPQTIRWSFSLLDAEEKGEHFYAKSEVRNSPLDFLSADKTAQQKILKLESERDRLYFRALQINSLAKRQSQLSGDTTWKQQADRNLVLTLNLLCQDYHAKRQTWPTGVEDLQTYSQTLGLGTLPQPFSGFLVYQTEQHVFTLKE